MDAADTSFIATVYDLLARGKYSVARKLGDFGVETIRKHASDENRRIIVVNRAQAYKWSGDEEACRRLLQQEDWTASSGAFQLCVAVLEDRYGDAAALMRRLGAEGGIREVDYEDWPAFRRFRQSSEFAEAYKAVFGKAFVHLEKVISDRHRELARERLRRFRDELESGLDGPGGERDEGTG